MREETKMTPETFKNISEYERSFRASNLYESKISKNAGECFEKVLEKLRKAGFTVQTVTPAWHIVSHDSYTIPIQLEIDEFVMDIRPMESEFNCFPYGGWHNYAAHLMNSNINFAVKRVKETFKEFEKATEATEIVSVKSDNQSAYN